MAPQDTFHCQVITPEATVADRQASFVVLTAHDGQVGFLRNRAPYLGELGTGECRIETPENVQRYFIDGGFVQMLDNRLLVLTQNAVPAEQIDIAQEQASLEELEHTPTTQVVDRETHAHKLRSIKAKIKLARKSLP